VIDPNGYVATLKFGHDLVRLSITHVDDEPVPPPYLPQATYMDWSIRTAKFLELAFEQLHPLSVLNNLLHSALKRAVDRGY
jgi:hypothetical protein